MFKRRKGNASDAEDVEQEADEAVEQDEQPAPQAGEGPHDAAAAPQDDIPRVDLGGLKIPIVDGMELHLEGHDEEAGSFAVAIVVLEEQGSALQLMAVAAPRSGGFWDEVMEELESEIQQAGGSITRTEGRFGVELQGQVPAQDAEGKTGLQPARFVGAEGNRWFIRGMFMGNAAVNPAVGEFFEDILAGCIVDRGERPMAPGDLIPLTPPEDLEEDEATDDDDDSSAYEDMEPFERGPEITETR